MHLVPRARTPGAAPVVEGGPDLLVEGRALAVAFGERFGVAPVFTGAESDSAWLVDTSEARQLFGAPEVPLRQLVDWTADWVARGGASLGKATHYEVRDGNY